MVATEGEERIWKTSHHSFRSFADEKPANSGHDHSLRTRGEAKRGKNRKRIVDDREKGSASHGSAKEDGGAVKSSVEKERKQLDSAQLFSLKRETGLSPVVASLQEKLEERSEKRSVHFSESGPIQLGSGVNPVNPLVSQMESLFEKNSAKKETVTSQSLPVSSIVSEQQSEQHSEQHSEQRKVISESETKKDEVEKSPVQESPVQSQEQVQVEQVQEQSQSGEMSVQEQPQHQQDQTQEQVQVQEQTQVQVQEQTQPQLQEQTPIQSQEQTQLQEQTQPQVQSQEQTQPQPQQSQPQEQPQEQQPHPQETLSSEASHPDAPLLTSASPFPPSLQGGPEYDNIMNPEHDHSFFIRKFVGTKYDPKTDITTSGGSQAF